MRSYSTREAAQLIGLHPITLQNWITAKKVRPSIGVPMGAGRTLWRFTSSDVRRIRDYKATHYRKGRGRKKKRA